MFYDLFYNLCINKGVSPSKACLDMGLSRSLAAKWKNTSATPSADVMSKIADYFGVTTDYLLGKEKTEKKPTLTKKDEREIGLDDFTYAMQNETKNLTETDKQILLSMAKQLNEARKKRDGDSG